MARIEVPKFFFDIVDGEPFTDLQGTECFNEQAALVEARERALVAALKARSLGVFDPSHLIELVGTRGETLATITFGDVTSSTGSE